MRKRTYNACESGRGFDTMYDAKYVGGTWLFGFYIRFYNRRVDAKSIYVYNQVKRGLQ